MSMDLRSLLNDGEALPLLGIEEFLEGRGLLYRGQKKVETRNFATSARCRLLWSSPSRECRRRTADRVCTKGKKKKEDEEVKNSPTPPLLFVAPHPDDETLGCGGAIALLRQLDLPVAVLVISDGTKSHPNSRKYPAPALKKLREQESLAALAILGVEAEAITFFGLPDCAVPTPEEPEYQTAIARCRNYLNHLAPTTIFLPWRDDPHRDHRATWKLIDDASKDLPSCPRLIEYPIWSWNLQKPYQIRESVIAWRLDVSAIVEKKQQAIAQYRSQITNLIDDDPQGFRLAPEMLENFTHSWEILF